MPLNPFILRVLDLLHEYAPVRARRMYGGHGIYQGDLMFAMVVNDVLYVKADDETLPDFTTAGMVPFVSDTKRVLLQDQRYYTVPIEALTDFQLLRQWTRKGYEAAQREAEAGRFKKV